MRLNATTMATARSHLVLWFLIVSSLTQVSYCTHIKGIFLTHDFFKLIAKFGFQKADTHLSSSYGYIFGNVTSKDGHALPLTLVVLDKPLFLELYNNRTNYAHSNACSQLFSKLEMITYDVSCNWNGKHDFFRNVPCPVGELCLDEDEPENVVAGNQFTYVIKKVQQPRFWYVAMVACYRNRTTCKWHPSSANSRRKELPRTVNTSSRYLNVMPYSINFDIHVVNEHPKYSASHPLTYQFSFEQQTLLEMYLIFLLVYLVLLPMQIYAVRLQRHPVTKLFTLSLFSEFISLVFITIHLINFALNGVGEPNLQVGGDILDIFSRTTFMLILLMLAKGWAVTRQQISRMGWIILISIWVPYCILNIFLYAWNKTEVDIVSDIDEYQTPPGWIVLILRTMIMMWFIYELRNTMEYEHSTKKLDFLLHLGASSLVWFIYLPIGAIVALQISPMWRYKLLQGIINSADCLGYCAMTGLLWPNRTGQYLLLTGSKYGGMEELDEFNEAPHIVRERERRNVLSDDIATNPNCLIVNVDDTINSLDSTLTLNTINNCKDLDADL